ncbi:MAG: helix-turn-helix domain-containing protein [Lachnospiraceae bacterium]
MISYAPLFKTMNEKKITSYKLEKLGFSRATYHSIRNGNSVSTNTINQLCKLLNCNVADIIEFIDDESNENNKEQI